MSPKLLARGSLRNGLHRLLRPFRIRRGWRGPALLALSLAVLPPLALRTCFAIVEPGQVGVRTDQFGGGVEPLALQPGLHLVLPGVHGWQVVNGTTRFAVFGAPGAEGVPEHPLEVRTRDESTARLGLAVPYRLIAEEAPALVSEGLTRGWEDRVRGAIENLLRARLAALSTNEWFDPDLRGARAAELLPELRARLADLHAEPLDLLLFDVRFHPEFERELTESQVLHQRELLLLAHGRRDAAASVSNRVEKDAALALAALQAERDLEIVRRRRANRGRVDAVSSSAAETAARVLAEAQRDREAARAQARRVMDSTRAAAHTRRLELLAGPGGDAWLARETARNLRLEHVRLDAADETVPRVLSPNLFAQWLLEK